MSGRELLTGVIDKALDKFKGNDSGNNFTLMMLGRFKFSVNTTVFQSLVRSTSWRWPVQERMNKIDALQFTGPGSETMTLPRVIYPSWKGGRDQMNWLRWLAAKGEPQRMIGPGGEIMGEWVIESVEETQSLYIGGDLCQKQEFSVSLRRYSDGPDVLK
ncbi:MAG: hypothetical protein GAK31_00930 [Stenotrophomonas maltophilia]|uniref:Phage tail protein n=1 Tax=Stenotrophomonas maltophilia TaxID=40324 RepID=A0A7V8FKF8_STEMA|nr:MAG: hypothetical protein GAK31_00930 [Stenotrophomonas maltophilia]